MNDQEKQRAAHLLILLCYTIFSCVLIGESLLLGWEMWVVVLLPIGVIAGWTMHIRNRMPMALRLDIYSFLMMLVFFFYGIHETSMFDLAPVMITLMVLYSSTEKYSTIKICMFTYYLTMGYDFFLVPHGFSEETPLFITRLLLHFMLVYMAGRLLKTVVERRVRERKSTEEMIARLEEINRRTEDFLANVSHELRTPINAVTGISSVMLKNETDSEKKKDLFTIQMAGQRLFGQIEDILDYTEIDNEKVSVSEEAYMISSIVNDVISENQMQEREYMPEMIFDLDAAMPASLLGDGKKIKKILKHLVNNAVKFTKKGGVYVKIHALVKDYGVNLCMTVSDTGEGISEEELEKITEGFYQTDGGRNRRAGGLGLGLPIVAGMVSYMEGFMQIKSEEGRGTVVSVSIPQRIADQKPLVTLKNRERLCLACYLNVEKYETPEVRDYYNETITHMVEGMDVSIHRVFHTDELKALTGICQITHLFIGSDEYEENSALFEDLADRMTVIVIADQHFVPLPGMRAKLLRKPFYCLPIANMLNAETVQAEFSFEEKRMLCPDVRVLVVDDEPMNLMVAEGIFREYEMQVKTVPSGLAALELCGKEDFDLIFLDHMMPEMDGVETLKRLRKLLADSERSAIIIAFTANAVSGAREMFFEEGFDEFVSKPIEMVELERILRNVLPKSAIRYADKEHERERKRDRQDNKQPEAMQEQPVSDQSKQEKTDLLEKAGIHTKTGLQYCLDNTEFYEELLLKFASDADGKQEDIDRFFGQKDWENYGIMVHALKSTARMIGADDLSDQAKGLEDAAKSRDVEYIESHHENLLVKYKETAQLIRDIFSEEEKSGEQKGYQEISGLEFRRRLKEIEDSLNTFEADKAKTLIEKLGGFVYCGNPVAELLEETERDVDDFEMAAASEKVKTLIHDVGDGEA